MPQGPDKGKQKGRSLETTGLYDEHHRTGSEAKFLPPPPPPLTQLENSQILPLSSLLILVSL